MAEAPIAATAKGHDDTSIWEEGQGGKGREREEAVFPETNPPLGWRSNKVSWRLVMEEWDRGEEKDRGVSSQVCDFGQVT